MNATSYYIGAASALCAAFALVAFQRHEARAHPDGIVTKHPVSFEDSGCADAKPGSVFAMENGPGGLGQQCYSLDGDGTKFLAAVKEAKGTGASVSMFYNQVASPEGCAANTAWSVKLSNGAGPFVICHPARK